jgi:two-component system, chemotaxis family, chemotaxis protein CheY
VSNYSVKIMLVDDSRIMRRVQKGILESIGLTNIIEAGDGNDALQKLAENTDIDLVLLDWNMPNLNGLETLKAIKAMPETTNIPVIMVTSEADKARVLEAVKAGAVGYIVKPFEAGALEKKVTAVLGVK